MGNDDHATKQPDPNRRQRSFRMQAIVLRHQNFGEADRLLVIFSQEKGKLRAIAKGVRKPRSRKAGHLEPFTRVSLQLARGRDLMIVTQAETLEAYLPIREDLLLANEVLDAQRLGRLDARITVAVDSVETIAAAVEGGLREVRIDVTVGLPRCGCAPDQAGELAEAARKAGLTVRGVMGYEGHAMPIEQRADREAAVAAAMATLAVAHADVGGEVISAGGTGSYDTNVLASEIQAGSYALMDTSYARLGLPFRQALFVG